MYVDHFPKVTGGGFAVDFLTTSKYNLECTCTIQFKLSKKRINNSEKMIPTPTYT